MSTARSSGLTATLLNNGKVLAAGGSNGITLSSAELYDPITEQWTPTGSMTTPRIGHTATLLTDGKVLVAGGQVTTSLASAELYDPNTETWTLTGNMTTQRAGHMAILITTGPLTGMVLVAGGGSTCFACPPFLTSAELYDPSTGTWMPTDDMTIARYWNPSPPGTILPDGSALIIGGTTCCPYQWINKAESYDPMGQVWTPTSLKVTNANGAAVLLPDGKLLVAGGVTGTQPTSVNVADAELFDFSTGTWTATASMSTDRGYPSLTLLATGEALVAGGGSGGWTVCNDVNSAELYDSAAGTWSPTGNLTVARLGHTATLLPNGQVLAAGGKDCANHALSSAELYDLGIAAATKVYGSGTIDNQGNEVTFRFRASQGNSGKLGGFEFCDPAAGVCIAKADIYSLSISANTAADFSGSGHLEDGTKVRLKGSVTNNGSPGTSDTISITFDNGYSVSGTLTSGDIRIY
jgi:hypothetical protein